MEAINTLREIFQKYQIMSTHYDFNKQITFQVESFDFKKFQKEDENRFIMNKIVYFGDYKYTISMAGFSERVNILAMSASNTETKVWDILYTSDYDELL